MLPDFLMHPDPDSYCFLVRWFGTPHPKTFICRGSFSHIFWPIFQKKLRKKHNFWSLFFSEAPSHIFFQALVFFQAPPHFWPRIYFLYSLVGTKPFPFPPAENWLCSGFEKKRLSRKNSPRNPHFFWIYVDMQKKNMAMVAFSTLFWSPFALDAYNINASTPLPSCTSAGW